jgi:hypothetical protein
VQIENGLATVLLLTTRDGWIGALMPVAVLETLVRHASDALTHPGGDADPP